MSATEERTNAPENVQMLRAPDPLIPIPAVFPDSGDGWILHARSLATQARLMNPRVVFMGDSITQAWGADGLDEWNQRFAMLPSANMGIGGDRTQNVLWRIGDGALDGISPDLVVLLVGVNNLWCEVEDWSPKRVSEGVSEIVDLVRTACPSASVLCLGVLPTQHDPSHPLRAIVNAVNAHSAATLPTSDGRVQYFDIGHCFLSSDGSIPVDLMPDGCHLSPHGYQLFADVLEPLIKQILDTKFL